MVIRIIKYFASSVVLFGYAGWAMNVGLPLTGVLTPSWGWFFTITGVIAFLVAVSLIPKSVKAFVVEGKEVKCRYKSITELRKVLVKIEKGIDIIRREVEQIPLSHYETKYLEQTEGYELFKTKYSSEADAQYVALGMSMRIGENPEFSKRMDSEAMGSQLDDLELLKQKLPDTKLCNLVDNFIKMKRMQALAIINHKLYPNKLNRSASELIREDQVENSLEDTLKLVKKNITKRLNKLWNGAKYE